MTRRSTRLADKVAPQPTPRPSLPELVASPLKRTRRPPVTSNKNLQITDFFKVKQEPPEEKLQKSTKLKKSNSSSTKKKSQAPTEPMKTNSSSTENSPPPVKEEELPPVPVKKELSSYELQRLETIRQNQEFMRSLNLGSVVAVSAAIPRPVPKRSPPKRVKVSKPTPEPTRVSRRLRGEKAEVLAPNLLKTYNMYMPSLYTDSGPVIDKVEAESPTQAKQARRIATDDSFTVSSQFGNPVSKLCVSGNAAQSDDFSLDTGKKDITDEDIAKRLSGLQCVTNGSVKLTQERIYTMAVHPGPQRILVAAGSKTGQLALWDGSAYAENFRNDPNTTATAHEDYDPELSITRFQPHHHAIAGLKFHPEDTAKVVTSSHDGTIRLSDMVAQKIVSAITGDTSDPLSFTSLDMVKDQPHNAFFATHSGQGGFHDLRTGMGAHPTSVFQLNNYKKIGCLSVNPIRSHLFATGSLDRTLKIWDLRQLKSGSDPEPVVDVDFPLSVSSAHWDPTGTRLVTTSYENALRVFDTSALLSDPLEATAPQLCRSNHNCRTGKYVTILQARFHPDPILGHRVTSVGDMARGVSFYSSSTGAPLVHLRNPQVITTVPAVLAYHPQATLGSSNPLGSCLALGYASGRVTLLM